MTAAVGWWPVSLTDTPGVYEDRISEPGFSGGFAVMVNHNQLGIEKGRASQAYTYTIGDTVTAEIAADIADGARLPGIECWTVHGFPYAKARVGGFVSPGGAGRVVALLFDDPDDVYVTSHADAPQDVVSKHLTSATVLAAVGGDSIAYVFSSATGAGDVDQGVIRLNDTTENASTILRANLLNPEGGDVSAQVDALGPGDRLFLAGSIFGNSSPDQWIAMDVTSAATPSGFTGQVDIGVTVVAASETSPFTDEDQLTLWLPD